MIEADFVFVMPAAPLALCLAWRAVEQGAAGLAWAMRAGARGAVAPTGRRVAGIAAGRQPS